MGASRLNAAVDRIERALVRLESAADALPPSPSADAGATPPAVRAALEQAIARLDGLLAEAEQG